MCVERGPTAQAVGFRGFRVADPRERIRDLRANMTLQHATGITFRLAPPGYILQWHCAPRRQYTITLSGAAEVEVGDGTVARVGPGDVLLAEDLTGQGHITRVVGTEPRFYAVVPLAEA